MPTSPITPANSIQIHGFNVWDEGCRERLNQTDPWAERTIVSNWSDRIPLSIKMCGGFNPATGLFTAPDVYPDYQILYAQEFSTQQIPVGGLSVGTNGMVAALLSRNTIVYRRLKYDLSGSNSLGEIHIQYGSESAIASRTISVWTWADGKVVFPLDNPVIQTQTAVLTLTRYNLSALPTDLNFSLVGKVNNATFLGAAAGTLRYDGMADDKQISFVGVNAWSASFRFSWRSTGWNSLFKPTGDTPGWYLITAKDGVTKPYATGNFNQFYDFT